MKRFTISILLVISFAQFIFAQCENDNCGLVIRGKVTDLEVDRSDKDSVRFFVKLDVEFSNEGKEPIILFKPSESNNKYWLGGWLFYQSEESAKSGKSIFSDSYGSSVRDNDAYRKLAKKLNVKSPPDEYTKILQPKESWQFSDDFQIYFDAEKNNRFPVKKTWKEMQKISSIFWVRIVYEISPYQIETSKPHLIRKLKKRWKTYGNVLIYEGSKSGSFGISSEPMLIDFSQAKEKTKEANK